MQDDCWNWTELEEALDGDWLLAPQQQAGPGIGGVVDDSRRVNPGCLFVAVRGDLADGHDYIGMALDRGAAAICCDRELPDSLTDRLRHEAIPTLRVRDSLTALQRLARQHRRRFAKLFVVAITGSSGKTSTKEMIAAVLERAYPGAVLKTEGNTNNHFGVPRNLLRLTANHQAAVIELGSNHPGEIAALAALVEPDVGVVSNIGPAHLEFFGDLAGVAREKSAVLEHTAWSGVAIFPGEAPGVDELARRAGNRRTLTFGAAPHNDIRIDYLGRQNQGWAVDISWTRTKRTERLHWPVSGAHQALNAGAAAAVGTAMGLEPRIIVEALANTRLPGMRMELLCDARQVTWVNDAYNANPASMRAGILDALERGRTAAATTCILVLGDMLELGDCARKEHARLLDWVRQEAPDATIVGVGSLMAAVAAERGLPGFARAPEARDFLKQHCRPKGWVFLKGSRAVGLEILVPEDARPNATP